MIVIELKKRVYKLTDKLQAVLGYIELRNYSRAMDIAKEIAADLISLGTLLHGLDVVALPSDAEIRPPVAVLPVKVALDQATLTDAEEAFLRELDKTRPDASVILSFQQLYIDHEQAKEKASEPSEIDTTKKPPASEHNRRKTDHT